MSKKAATLEDVVRKPGRNGTPTPRERLWAAHFVTDPARNATEAARAAGYAHPKIEGHRCRSRPRVKAMVAHLEAEARKLLKTRKPKKGTVEVLPPGYVSPVQADVSLEQHEQAAVVSHAEALAVATNIIRTHEQRKVKDLWNTTEDGKVKNMLMDPDKIGELPLTVLRGLKHDAAGDLELKLADPLVAARLILDDHRRAAEGRGAVDLAGALLEVLRGAVSGRAALPGGS